MTNFLQTAAVWVPLVLHPVKDAATHDLLRGVLNEPDPVVRERALEALGLVKAPQDAALVRKLLDFPFEATRQQAARTAGSLDVPLRPSDLAAANTTRRIVPATTHPPLAQALRSTDAAVVASALHRMNAADVQSNSSAILARLDGPEIALQEEAVRASGRGGLAQAIPHLLLKLDDPDEALRRASAEALDVLSAKGQRLEIIGGVVKRLETDDSSLVREAAGRVLLTMHDDSALAALRKLLRHDRGVTRHAAAQTLGGWGEPAIARDLEPLLADPADLVARIAAESLGRLGNAQSKAPLIAALKGRKPFVQEKIAWALGELRATEAIGAVTELLATEQEALKVEAVRALGKTGDKRALPPLRQVLASISALNPMPRTRVAALEALQAAGDKPSIPRAIALVTQPVVPPVPGGGPTYDESIVRVAALKFLAALGDKATGAALQAGFKVMAPRDIRPAVAETYTVLTGRTYVPLPDEAFQPHFVESVGFLTPTPLPLPGVRLAQ